VGVGIEKVESEKTRRALPRAVAETKIVSPAGREVEGRDVTDWGSKFTVDTAGHGRHLHVAVAAGPRRHREVGSGLIAPPRAARQR
jgi:hypothetical protein